jgi:hypothetical protein
VQDHPVLSPRLQLPDTLLTCLPQPTPGNIADDADLADYILDLADAGDDCRSKVSRIKEIMGTPQ